MYKGQGKTLTIGLHGILMGRTDQEQTLIKDNHKFIVILKTIVYDKWLENIAGVILICCRCIYING